MDYKKLTLFGSYISKEYSAEIFRLLIKYSDISSSEAASRLNLHIKTTQDFLEAMAESGILTSTLVSDKKRPYYRYSLIKNKIDISLDLNSLIEATDSEIKEESVMIRERNNSGARFTTDRYDSYFSSVTIPVGEGRTHGVRKINLTTTQGKFLYNLPFPGANPASIEDLLISSGLCQDNLPEIADIVDLLINENIIETINQK